MSEIHKCPVCEGRGLVPNGFYEDAYWPQTTINTGNETCRSCNGKGYIVIDGPFSVDIEVDENGYIKYKED